MPCYVENNITSLILDNDANALIYAEALWGAGRNAGSVLGFMDFTL